MSFQIMINVVLACIWMFLTENWTAQGFVLGYMVGLLLIFLLRRFLPYEFYLRKVVAIINLILLFLKELVISSFAVMKHVLNPRLTMQPGIFALRTELKTDWEITTLACLITLTPGTLTLDISPDKEILYIHAMDVPDAEEAIKQIKTTFEKAIMEVTR